MKAGNIIYYFVLALCVVLMVIGLIVGSRADAVDLEEPEKVGMLVIQAVLREQEREPVTLTPKIDNERKLAMRQARQERKNVSRVTEVSEDETEEVNTESQRLNTESQRKYLGRYKITGYCTCSRCCGNSNGITASGTTATVGRTCAAAKGIPFGTVLYIDGIGERVVEDRGGFASNVIDVLCEDHPACYAITGWYDVWEVVEP